MARVLAVGEYEKLFEKATGRKLGDVWTHEHSNAVSQMKQVHRLLCEGRKLKDLTPSEQLCAPAFEGLKLTQIPNDYGWEPGIEEVETSEPDSETLRTAPPPKPKKNGK